MYRRWGDLRLLIDRRMKQKRSTRGPFSIDEAIHLMLNIAEDMDTLHTKHDILHRDLKASNVLVWGEFGESDLSLVAPPNRVVKIGLVVVDCECSVGVLGTGFWRAPEILKQVKNRVPHSKVQFTRESDVYSYGMTCYEIVTGCIPYDGLGGEDMISQILQGGCPELQHELLEFVRNIIIGCWHSDPRKRSTFSDICMALKLKRGPNPVSVVMDNTSKGGTSIIKVERWNNPQPSTLLEVTEILTHMDLLVLKASDSSSTDMITQYFEVTNRKRKKVVNDKSIANITKVLTLPIKMKWINESLKIPIDGTPSMQMYVLEVVAKQNRNFILEILSRVLVATNFHIHSTGCWIREGRIECVICVEGTRMDTLLWKLRHNRELFSLFNFKIIAHKVTSKEFLHFNRHLHNLKSIDLTLPCSSSNIYVYQKKECEKGFTTNVVVCLGRSELLVHVSSTLVDLNYKISQAKIGYRDPFYKFLKGRGMKSKDIKLETSGSEEMGNMKELLDVAIKCGYPVDNGGLIVSGPEEELHNDLMRSFCENGLIVTSGQVCCVSDKHISDYPSYHRYLEFFITENLIVEAG